MSIFYDISVKLDLQFTEETVRFILHKSLEPHCTYMRIDDCTQPFQRFNIDEAIEKLLTETNSDNRISVDEKIQNTVISIRVYKTDENILEVSFGDFSFRWDREGGHDSGMYMIDFARYIRLMLQICQDIPILELHTFVDVLDDVEYGVHNCIVASVSVGYFNKQFSDNSNEAIKSVKYFLQNGMYNKFIFFDENSKKHIEPSLQKCHDILKAGLPLYLYATKNNVPFKIEIKKNADDYRFVALYPLEPYHMKKRYESDEEKLDVAFYIQCLIELCENFTIYALKTFF